VNPDGPARTQPEGRPTTQPEERRDLSTDHPAVRAVIALLTVAAAVAVGAEHRNDPIMAALLLVTIIVFGFLAAIDAAEQRLPNRVTLPLAAATTAAVLADGVLGANLGVILGPLGIGLGFAALFLVLRFGMGDVKLAFTVGTIAGWLGRDAVMATAYVGAISGAAMALVLILVHGRRELTFGFGPFLVLGSVAGMLVAGP